MMDESALHGLVNHAHILWGLGEATELDLKLLVSQSIRYNKTTRDIRQTHRCRCVATVWGAIWGGGTTPISDDQVSPYPHLSPTICRSISGLRGSKVIFAESRRGLKHLLGGVSKNKGSVLEGRETSRTMFSSMVWCRQLGVRANA